MGARSRGGTESAEDDAVSVDAFAKRWFSAFVAGALAIGAYFTARGACSLVGAEIVTGAPIGGVHAITVPPPSPPPDRAADAELILTRNVFDSTTGRLDGREDPAVQAHAAANADPYEDPDCSGGRVLLIAGADSPEWSFAVVAQPGIPRGVMRRRGDPVGSATVVHVGWDRIWLASAEGRCQLRLGEADRGAKAAPQPTTAPPPTAPGARGSPGVPPEIASRIRQTGEREFKVERGALDMILERQADLMRSARVFPVREGNDVVGVGLMVKPNSVLSMLGLKSGDVVRSINGFSLADPQKALEAYARLRSADRLQLDLVRQGQGMTLDYGIQ